MTTPNKGYATPVTGTEAGTWGDDLNNNVFGIVDNNLGGIVTKSLSSSNVSLNSTESQMAIARLTGTILANIQVTTSCIGFFFVENLTAGAFDITVTNGIAGAVVPKGHSIVLADATNGCRIGGTDSFPPGTRMTFNQTTAPTGWTKDASTNNAAFRLVSGSVGSGGSVDFTVAFASQTPAGTVGNTTLTVDQIPSHSHVYSRIGGGGGGIESGSNLGFYNTATGTTQATGGGNSHTHSFTGNAINLAVKFVDLILAVKN